VVINVLEQYIMTRFGVSNSLLFDNTTYFSFLKLDESSLDKEINLKYAANFYPQRNGVVEYTNKNICFILKCVVVHHLRNWHNDLPKNL
jgi:hypothetical protein